MSARSRGPRRRMRRSGNAAAPRGDCGRAGGAARSRRRACAFRSPGRGGRKPPGDPGRRPHRAPARGRARRPRHRGHERPRARGRRRGAPGSARSGRADRRGPRQLPRSDLPGGPSLPRGAHRGAGSAGLGIPLRHPARAVELSVAQPHHQRSLARGPGRGSGGPERLSHHRPPRRRPGARGVRGAGVHPESAQLRLPPVAPGRRQARREGGGRARGASRLRAERAPVRRERGLSGRGSRPRTGARSGGGPRPRPRPRPGRGGSARSARLRTGQRRDDRPPGRIDPRAGISDSVGLEIGGSVQTDPAGRYMRVC